MWNAIFFNPILNLMLVLYHFLGDNWGLAIIVIAILVRLLLLPLVKKQTDMTRKMTALKPQLDSLQKKYENNQEKLAQEQMKLYKKSGYNPLGCLFTQIPQLLLVIVLFQVVISIGTADSATVDLGTVNPETVSLGTVDPANVYNFIKPWVVGENGKIEIHLESFGIDLGKSYWGGFENKFAVEALPHLALVLLTGISQFFATKFTQLMQNPEQAIKKKEDKKKKEPQELSPEELQKNMAKSTNYMMPLMAMMFAVDRPASITLYWVVQSLMLVVQYVLLDWDKTKKGVQNLITVMRERKEKKEK